MSTTTFAPPAQLQNHPEKPNDILRIESIPITLRKTSRKKYQVQYGMQIKSGLDYHEAAKEIGYCIMHAMTCAGYGDGE